MTMQNNDANTKNGADEAEEYREPSRSQLKREVQELQQIGKQLVKLNQKVRMRLNLEPTLDQALQEYQRIKVPNAIKRQMQYIGKLLQKTDVEKITHQLEELQLESRRKKNMAPEVDAWCVKILDDNQSVNDFVDLFPNANRQTLRNLARTASKTLDANKQPDKRKLFTYIKNIISESISAQNS